MRLCIIYGDPGNSRSIGGLSSTRTLQYFHLSDGAFIRLTNRIYSLPATTRQFHSRARANYNLQFLILRNTKLYGLTSYFNGFPKTIPTHVSVVNRLNNLFGLYLLKLSENVNYGNYGGKR